MTASVFCTIRYGIFSKYFPTITELNFLGVIKYLKILHIGMRQPLSEQQKNCSSAPSHFTHFLTQSQREKNVLKFHQSRHKKKSSEVLFIIFSAKFELANARLASSCFIKNFDNPIRDTWHPHGLISKKWIKSLSRYCFLPSLS